MYQFQPKMSFRPDWVQAQDELQAWLSGSGTDEQGNPSLCRTQAWFFKLLLKLKKVVRKKLRIYIWVWMRHDNKETKIFRDLGQARFWFVSLFQHLASPLAMPHFREFKLKSVVRISREMVEAPKESYLQISLKIPANNIENWTGLN